MHIATDPAAAPFINIDPSTGEVEVRRRGTPAPTWSLSKASKSAILTLMEPARGIMLKSETGEEIDSVKLIARRQRVDLALLQLERMIATAQALHEQSRDAPAPHAGLYNNLGCAYAWMGDFLAALENWLRAYEEDTQSNSSEGKKAKRLAINNLLLVDKANRSRT